MTAPRDMPPAATVYVPTLAGGDALAACLRSLERQTVPVRAVVADNGPGEGCAPLVESQFPRVERVGFGRNLGFGAALNRAIAETGEGPIILLNDDAEAEPGFVEALLGAGEGVEMAAAVLTRAREPDRIDSAGILVDQTLMAFDYLSGEPLAALEGCADPAAPTGGAALYSREAFERIGGFDERIFLYYEDLDLGLRIRAEGGRCRLAPAARAAHAYSATLGARNPNKYRLTGWSRGYLARRYGVARRPANLAGLALRETVVCAGQLLRDRTAAGVRGRIEGWRAAAGLEPRQLPPDAVTRMSAGAALRLRRRRS